MSLQLIDQFTRDIYYNLPNRINEDYLKICTEFDRVMAMLSENPNMVEYRQKSMAELLTRMESADFIWMAEGLQLYVKPIIAALERTDLQI